MFSKENWSVERLAVLLTPLVFAPLAAAVSAYVAAHFPGLPHPSSGQIEGVEIGAFVISGGLVAKWLHGRQLPAIAGLPSLEAEIKRVLAQGNFSGPPGARGEPGVTPEQVKGFIHDEITRLLGGAATAPSRTP